MPQIILSKPTTLYAAATAAALSFLFCVIYGGCSWITAHRSDVGTWYYSWEKLIPFVPIMIIPYMSINAFFVSAPFLCQTHAELHVLARRIAVAILVAGACFLLIPLRLPAERQPSKDWMASIFKFLYTLDQPYNLFPSLHITFRTILADFYARHTKGLVRWTSHLWFILIGFSTVLTYQHHCIDVVGGFALAAICFYLFRYENKQLPLSRES